MSNIIILVLIVITYTLCKETNLEFLEKDSTSEHSLKLARLLLNDAIVRFKKDFAFLCPMANSRHEWRRIFQPIGYIETHDEDRALNLILPFEKLMNEIPNRIFWVGMRSGEKNGVPVMELHVISNCK